MKKVLNLCPMCNSHCAISFTESEFSGDTYFTPYCTECGLTGKNFLDREDAVKFWNTRYKPMSEDIISEELNSMILSTPSGKGRDHLCDINILWHALVDK